MNEQRERELMMDRWLGATLEDDASYVEGLRRENRRLRRRVAELEGRNATRGLRRDRGGDLAAVDSGADRAVREYRG